MQDVRLPLRISDATKGVANIRYLNISGRELFELRERDGPNVVLVSQPGVQGSKPLAKLHLQPEQQLGWRTWGIATIKARRVPNTLLLEVSLLLGDQTIELCRMPCRLLPLRVTLLSPLGASGVLDLERGTGSSLIYHRLTLQRNS